MSEQQLDVLVFGAHPDDVELMCGGTMIKMAQKGYRIGAVSLTAGEMGSRGSAQIRSREFDKASEIMGLALHKVLDIADGRVSVCDENKQKVIQEIRRYRPTIVFAPYWRTRHPDHGHCSALVREASFLSGLKKIQTEFAAYRPVRVIHYMERFEFLPSFIVNITEAFEKKLDAIKAYKSQIYQADDSQEETEKTYISSYSFLQSIVFKSQYWGHKIGCLYGEPFYCNELINIDDPVQHFRNYVMAGLL